MEQGLGRSCTPRKQSGRASGCLQETPLPYVPVFCESGRRNREVRRVWRADPLDNSTWNQHNPLDVIQRCPPAMHPGSRSHRLMCAGAAAQPQERHSYFVIQGVEARIFAMVLAVMDAATYAQNKLVFLIANVVASSPL